MSRVLLPALFSLVGLVSLRLSPVLLRLSALVPLLLFGLYGACVSPWSLVPPTVFVFWPAWAVWVVQVVFASVCATVGFGVASGVGALLWQPWWVCRCPCACCGRFCAVGCVGVLLVPSVGRRCSSVSCRFAPVVSGQSHRVLWVAVVSAVAPVLCSALFSSSPFALCWCRLVMSGLLGVGLGGGGGVGAGARWMIVIRIVTLPPLFPNLPSGGLESLLFVWFLGARGIPEMQP